MKLSAKQLRRLIAQVDDDPKEKQDDCCQSDGCC